MSRVFANGPADRSSIPGRVIPKDFKNGTWYILLNTQHYKVRIKGKVENQEKGVAPSPATWCCSFWKGRLQIVLDYGHHLYIYIYIYRYIYTRVRRTPYTLFLVEVGDNLNDDIGSARSSVSCYCKYSGREIEISLGNHLLFIPHTDQSK